MVMIGKVLRMHHREKKSVREIAKATSLARNTVRSAIRSDAPPVFDRKPRPSAVDAVEPQIRALLAEFPRMPATVIAERIGWTRSLTILKDRVRELRPIYLPADPCQRTEYQPGELAQWDLWFPPAKIPLGFGQSASPPVIVGVSGYSRVIAARMIPNTGAKAPDLVVDKNVFRSSYTLVNELRADTRTWRAALMNCWFWFVGAFVMTMLPIMVKDILGGSEIVVPATTVQTIVLPSVFTALSCSLPSSISSRWPGSTEARISGCGR